jgi:hypothetical protein
MMIDRRPTAVLITLAISAWLAPATLAQARASPADAPVSTQQAQPDAPPQIQIQGSAPGAGKVEADAGAAAGGSDGQVPAIRPVDPGKWSFTASPYLWMASVKTAATFMPAGADRTISADVHQSFSDIFHDLNFAIMAAGEARRGPLSVQGDAIYINLLQKDSGVRSVSGPLGLVEVPVNIGGKLKLTEKIFTLTGGYDIFRNDQGFVQLFGGFRYLGLRSTLDWNFQGPLGNLARLGSVESQSDIWNGIAGIRGEHALGHGAWKALYDVDVGSGGSKLTWQALLEAAYVKRWGDIGIGWRTLEFSQGSQNSTADLRMSGPIVSVSFRFGG